MLKQQNDERNEKNEKKQITSPNCNFRRTARCTANMYVNSLLRLCINEHLPKTFLYVDCELLPTVCTQIPQN